MKNIAGRITSFLRAHPIEFSAHDAGEFTVTAGDFQLSTSRTGNGDRFVTIIAPSIGISLVEIRLAGPCKGVSYDWSNSPRPQKPPRGADNLTVKG